jgi:WD40 repeat protein
VIDISSHILIDSTLIGGSRSVNVVTAATYSGYNIVCGSTDGSVKLWDLRHPKSATFNLSGHGAPVRSLTFGRTPSFPVHVVLGQESGMITRYDLRVRSYRF